jgi:iron complex outermembrane recepter protein
MLQIGNVAVVAERPLNCHAPAKDRGHQTFSAAFCRWCRPPAKGGLMTMLAKALLATTAVMALSTGAVHAQDTAQPPSAGTQFADAGQATEAGDIVVLGFGQSRQVQSVSADDIARLTPGTTPLKAVEKLPGVNFQSSDPFGAYEWSTRISLRGFNQNQLGFTLDDVPLGDMSYGNYNGLHVSRAIISENVATVNVAQGAGALGTASTSNLGGTLQFVSRTPGDTFDFAASGTYGSNNTIRGFARVDSGQIRYGIQPHISLPEGQILLCCARPQSPDLVLDL